MVVLRENEYHLVHEPLNGIQINKLFARSVIEKKVAGKVYVNDPEHPTTFYIIHPYGMTLLLGDSDDESFNTRFVDYAFNRSGERSKDEWMQAMPDAWDEKLKALFGDRLVPSQNNITPGEGNVIELNTRVNFKFNLHRFQSFKEANIKENLKVVRTDEEMFHEMEGTVTPSHFWNNADDFTRNGVGYSLFYQGKLAATAYSSVLLGTKLEIGIETIPTFRGRGFALYVCAALLDYCIENHYEPIWACMLENVPSYKLAQKLGFEPSLSLPYYRLKV